MAESWEIVGDVVGGVVGGVAGGVVRGVGAVAKLFDGGEPGENDQGSCHWPGWEHEAICSMLDTTVDPGDVHEGARIWNDQRLWAADIVKRLTDDLRGTVSNGWRGGSADAAIASLEPVDRWSASQSDAAEHTGRLLDDSGSAAGQAKATVPPAVHHNWRESLTSFAVGGVPGAFVDAIAQDQAQEDARREAVHIMTRVYSAPIKDNRAAVPAYPQLIDPTLRPPEPSPVGGPTPGAGLSGGWSGVPGGGDVPGGSAPYQPPAAGLQSAGAGSVDGAQFESAQSTGSQQSGRGQGYGGSGYPGQGGQGLSAAAAAVPFMPPMAGGGEQERARRGSRGAGPPGGRGGGGYPGGHPSGGRGGDFGPRGSNPGAAAAVGEGRAGPGAGGAAGGRGGSGAPGGVPVGGAGGRGQGGEDTEHRRPSYLIEMNDIFNDGRKVAPPVIGVDLPEDHH